MEAGTQTLTFDVVLLKVHVMLIYPLPTTGHSSVLIQQMHGSNIFNLYGNIN